ncbi:MAG: hypothetical protein C0622_07555 [Desulfuromonas sp.]|nr:MAG: hypothetical protein C0622_07555 [Desulfuromonas sp.]
MICSTSCSNRFLLLPLALLVVLLLGGCAGLEHTTVSSSGNTDLPARLEEGALYALLPIENLSASRAPLAELDMQLRNALKERGIRLLEPERLETFMREQRMRSRGGINLTQSRALRDLGVAGVFITALETWREGEVPRVSLIMRLVQSGDEPEILWIDGVGRTGDEAPGLLGLGLVKDVRQLTAGALERLLDSFVAARSGAEPGTAAQKKRHQPKYRYRAADFDPAAEYRVAVIPFLNVDTREHAGRIVGLHVVRQLQRYGNLKVLEPGLVREALLSQRMIMQEGPSLEAAELLAAADVLGADLVVSGRVFAYEGDAGESKVDFSLQIFSGIEPQVIWTSHSYGGGDDGVYFFDRGRVPSAHELAGRLAEAAIGDFAQ